MLEPVSQLVNYVFVVYNRSNSVCMLVHMQGCMCVCMFVYRVVMIGDGATDMEAAPPAVSPKPYKISCNCKSQNSYKISC